MAVRLSVALFKFVFSKGNRLAIVSLVKSLVKHSRIHSVFIPEAKLQAKSLPAFWLTYRNTCIFHYITLTITKIIVKYKYNIKFILLKLLLISIVGNSYILF